MPRYKIGKPDVSLTHDKYTRLSALLCFALLNYSYSRRLFAFALEMYEYQ